MRRPTTAKWIKEDKEVDAMEKLSLSISVLEYLLSLVEIELIVLTTDIITLDTIMHHRYRDGVKIKNIFKSEFPTLKVFRTMNIL